MVPQESLFMKIIIAWILVLVWVGWIHDPTDRKYQAQVVGVLVNINLVFFFGSPLYTIRQVLRDKCSNSIHAETMYLNLLNTTFWSAYGITQMDPVIYVPNLIGLMLGIAQGVLCLLFPRRGGHEMKPIVADENNPLQQSYDDTDHIELRTQSPEEYIPDLPME